MIECPSVAKQVVRQHYDLVTPFYWLLWGRHIHHGLWDAQESPAQAQQQLTDTLAREAGIRGGETVLDVGCGMGGSSIHLARTLDCQVTGITLSPLQRFWASSAARWNRVAGNTEFRCADAEKADFPPESFDVVWSIECTEHLYDKARFFRRAATWLRPGGRMAICAWLAGEALRRRRADSPGIRCLRRLLLSLAGHVQRLSEVDDGRRTGRRARLRLDGPRRENLGDMQAARAAIGRSLAGRFDRPRYGHVPRPFRRHLGSLSQRRHALWMLHRAQAVRGRRANPVIS